MIAPRLTVALLSTLLVAGCGGMHACTSDGVPCSEASVRSSTVAQGSGGAARSVPVAFPTATAAASAPFVPPPVDEPPPVAEAPTAAVAEPAAPTTTAAVADEEDTGRHRRRHGRHRGRGHRSRSRSSHSRHHRRH